MQDLSCSCLKLWSREVLKTLIILVWESQPLGKPIEGENLQPLKMQERAHTHTHTRTLLSLVWELLSLSESICECPVGFEGSA